MKKILIIEDDKDIRESVSDILQMQNFKVVEAENGKEGLMKAISEKPDLIILDVNMPEFDGFQLMEQLQNNLELYEIPVIFTTAKSKPEDFRTGLKLGAADYITKPFRMQELLNSVTKQLGKIEKHKQKEMMYFMLTFENPFAGVFYYKDDKFEKINRVFSELCGYTRDELNKIELKSLFPSNTEHVLNQITNCYQGLIAETTLQTVLMRKNKTAVKVSLFARNLSDAGKDALLVTIAETNENKKPEQFTAEMSSIIEYFKAHDNAQIIQEIMNTGKILELETDQRTEQLKNTIKLSNRELEVLQLICEGYTNQEIADKLFISSRTVDNHRAVIIDKTNSKNTAGLVAFAIKNKIVKI